MVETVVSASSDEAMPPDKPNRFDSLPLWVKIGLGVIISCLICFAFYLAPIDSGSDWGLIISGSERWLQGEPPWGLEYAYYAPPWLTVGFVPLAILPFELGLAIFNTLTLIAALALAYRYQLGLFKTLLLLTSPPVLFAIFLGQIDIVVLLVVFLPMELWFLGVLGKPQIAFGLAFAVLRKPKIWVRTVIAGLSVLALTVLIFGWWPGAILAKGADFSLEYAVHNFFGGLWPFQLIAGVGILGVAWEKNDERLYMASSPFLFPYAASYSLFSPLLAAFSMLNRWQSLLIWLTWWYALSTRV